MLPTPQSSPRVALALKTNTITTPRPKLTPSILPTPPADKKSKRRIPVDERPFQKRLKLSEDETEESDSDIESDEDQYMEDVAVIQARARRNTAYQIHTRFISGPLTTCRRFSPSTLPILRSFVSSQKSDTFKCQSIGADTYLTPPYACSYSRGAKMGRTPLLAVATEQGTLHIMDTTKRKDWDTETSRTTFQPHHNGVFDVKWNLDDTLLATCSGDRSTRITSAETGQITHVLNGHSGTVKCVSWDPSNASLLATGGRDGAICLWDLRIGGRLEDSDIVAGSPVMTIYSAHEDTNIKSRPKPRRAKQQHVPRTVTGLIYPESQPYGLVSSGSSDGILRYWDLRKPVSSRRTKPVVPTELYSSSVDPTTLHGSKRPRGIITLASGTGPSANLIFAIGSDSRIHTYNLPTLTPQKDIFSHENLQTSSFYVGLSVSPCGRWLASGSSGNKGDSFLFDIENASRPGSVPQQGIEIKGQAAEVCAVDWAQDMLATCLNDGVVRVWRPDIETYARCLENPEESRWDWSWSTQRNPIV